MQLKKQFYSQIANCKVHFDQKFVF